jgi:NTE family protein
VEVDGEFYWDGGLVSNTPLDWVLAREPGVDTLVFQIDLWSARGELPRDLSEVAVRTKEIQFSSRTRAATDEFRRFQRLRAEFHDLLGQLPQHTGGPYTDLLARLSSPAVCNIIQLIYRSQTYESHSKDYEFSRQTMEEHWAAGRRDALTSLERPTSFGCRAGPTRSRCSTSTTR